jgi:copper chaperone
VINKSYFYTNQLIGNFFTLKLLKMNRHKMAFKMFFIFVVLFAFACSSNKDKSAKTAIQTAPSVIEVSIGGMSCTDCEQTIQKRVGEIEGIKSVKASYVAGNAIIEFFPDKVDSVKIRQAITGSGYSVKKFTIPSN